MTYGPEIAHPAVAPVMSSLPEFMLPGGENVGWLSLAGDRTFDVSPVVMGGVP